MPTIDAQVHCYERNHPGRPWAAVLAGPPEVTAEDMIRTTGERVTNARIEILATLLKPSSGQANVAGLTIGYQNRQIRPLIGYVPDFMGAYEDMVVTEYLEFFAASYGIHGTQRDARTGDYASGIAIGYDQGEFVAIPAAPEGHGEAGEHAAGEHAAEGGEEAAH